MTNQKIKVKLQNTTAYVWQNSSWSIIGGLINYINDPRKNAILVASSDGINLTNNQTITDSFLMQAGLSARTKKPVGHFIFIRFHPMMRYVLMTIC